MNRIQQPLILCSIVAIFHFAALPVDAQSNSRPLDSLSSLVDRALGDIPQKELLPWQGKLQYRGTDWDGIFLRSKSNPALRQQLIKLVQGADQTVKASSFA